MIRDRGLKGSSAGVDHELVRQVLLGGLHQHRGHERADDRRG
jgi:hypothetical protein